MKAKTIAKKIWLLISAARLVPHIILMKYHPAREFIKKDIERWLICLNLSNSPETACNIYAFIELMTFYPEYRNVFYYRLGWTSKVLYPLCHPMPTFFISIVDEGIGPGLFVQHGWASSIAAQKIGRNLWIGQHCTIGYSNDNDKPVIGDNVTLFAGAKVFGNIRIGDNSIIGANAVVAKNVPANCTVIGNPAYIVRKNGVKVKEYL